MTIAEGWTEVVVEACSEVVLDDRLIDDTPHIRLEMCTMDRIKVMYSFGEDSTEAIHQATRNLELECE